MSQFPKPIAKAPRGRARSVNLNATMSAPGSPRAKTSRKTMAPGSLSTSCASTSAPSSLNDTVRSTSRSSSQSSKKAKKDPIRLAYMEYLRARGTEIALDIEAEKRAEKLTKDLVTLEINDKETYATLNEYEMRIKKMKAFIEANIKFQEQIEKIDCQLELKGEVMEHLERIHCKLQSMDKLIVRNIEASENEWDVLESLLEECDQVMDDLINNCKDYHLTLEIKESHDAFTDLFNAVSKHLHTINLELELLEADAIIAMGSKIKQ